MLYKIVWPDIIWLKGPESNTVYFYTAIRYNWRSRGSFQFNVYDIEEDLIVVVDVATPWVPLCDQVDILGHYMKWDSY